ncbi:dormancy-associated protein homolog 4 isoform X1 [Ziziphus jujuba]|uniref:Dormancy-associated protein homolog 4 isoform X1 n=1 Tax=Ziziphus jujuba TaxID=326968 RepID=A0A6P4BGK9_ZIZJJ|nr:dormancy-associated protein homolog 4 isoform X1 [Ziziphus jujuba]
MGFLHKLWDETLAGPAPDAGLGKLRKYDSFSATRSPSMALEDVPVTRSITLLRTRSNTVAGLSVDVPCSVPESPATSTTPTTPLTPETPAEGYFKKFTRRKSPAAEFDRAESTSLTIYDWVVINALDC